jgi:hypothetical protein
LKSLIAIIVPVMTALVAAGCGNTRPRAETSNEYSDAQIARAVSDTATRVAVSKIGAKVCRTLQVGISERDIIRGVVEGVTAEKIRVRINDAGRFPQSLEGVPVTRGALISDVPLNWTPCA